LVNLLCATFVALGDGAERVWVIKHPDAALAEGGPEAERVGAVLPLDPLTPPFPPTRPVPRAPSVNCSAPGSYCGWQKWSLIDAVQKWIRDPASNRGVLIKQVNEGQQSIASFASSNGSSAGPPAGLGPTHDKGDYVALIGRPPSPFGGSGRLTRIPRVWFEAVTAAVTVPPCREPGSRTRGVRVRVARRRARPLGALTAALALGAGAAGVALGPAAGQEPARRGCA
jgi:hypothetical protein